MQAMPLARRPMRWTTRGPRWAGLALLYLATSGAAAPQQAPAPQKNSFRLPSGFEIEQIAGPPLVQYPLFACLDDAGRLYVAEGTGTNLPGTELVKIKRGKVTLLEDADGDGKYDSAKTFAEGLVFPQGVLWHN